MRQRDGSCGFSTHAAFAEKPQHPANCAKQALNSQSTAWRLDWTRRRHTPCRSFGWPCRSMFERLKKAICVMMFVSSQRSLLWGTFAHASNIPAFSRLASTKRCNSVNAPLIGKPADDVWRCRASRQHAEPMLGLPPTSRFSRGHQLILCILHLVRCPL